MEIRTPGGLVRALVLGISIVACTAAVARAEARRIGHLGLAYATAEGEPSGLVGIDFMFGFAPREPLWLVAGMDLHFAGASRYTYGGQEVGRTLLRISAGPQVIHPWRRLRFFGHALVGYTGLSYDDPGLAPDSLATGPTADSPARTLGGRMARPAMASGYAGGPPSLVGLGGIGFAIGAGVDVSIGQRSALRVLLLEYTPSRLRGTGEPRAYAPAGVPTPVLSPDRLRFADQVIRDHAGWSHDLRLGVGIVFRPGRKAESAGSTR